MFGHHCTGNTAYGAAHENDRLAKVVAQKLRDLDPILDQTLKGEGAGAGFPVFAEGLARAALVPLDERQVLFPRAQQRSKDRIG